MEGWCQENKDLVCSLCTVISNSINWKGSLLPKWTPKFMFERRIIFTNVRMHYYYFTLDLFERKNVASFTMVNQKHTDIMKGSVRLMLIFSLLFLFVPAYTTNVNTTPLTVEHGNHSQKPRSSAFNYANQHSEYIVLFHQYLPQREHQPLLESILGSSTKWYITPRKSSHLILWRRKLWKNRIFTAKWPHGKTDKRCLKHLKTSFLVLLSQWNNSTPYKSTCPQSLSSHLNWPLMH
jgi:hypothetical protein